MITISPATVVRLYGAGAGLALGAYAFVDTQRMVWRNAAETCRTYGTLTPLAREPDAEMFFGPRTRALAGKQRERRGAIRRLVNAYTYITHAADGLPQLSYTHAYCPSWPAMHACMQVQDNEAFTNY